MRSVAPFLILMLIASAARGEGPAPRRLWERHLVRAPAVAPLIRGDTLFIAGMDRKILCLDARGGDRHWKRTSPGRVTFGLVRADSCLLVGIASPTAEIVALDCRNGRQRWSKRLESAPVSIIRLGRSVAVLEAGGVARCIDLRDGAERWSRRLKGPMAGMAAEGGALEILARKDSLWSLALSDGRPVWAVTVTGIHAAPPVIAGEKVIRLTYEGELVAHDGLTGAEIARTRVPPPQVAPPAVMDQSRCVTVATGGEARGLCLPDFEPMWSAPTGETTAGGAVLGGDVWVLACESGRIVGLRPDDGTVAWSLKAAGPISLPPASDGDKLGIADGEGHVAVYSLERGS